MARRRKRSQFNFGITAAVAYGAVLAIAALLSAIGTDGLSILASAIAASIGAFAGLRWWRQRRWRAWYEKTVVSLVREHAEALGRKRRQLVTVDEYGREDTRRWTKEMDRFVKAVIQADMGPQAAATIDDERDTVLGIIDAAARDASARMTTAPVERTPSAKEIGDEFELLCSDILSAAGWIVRRVGASGDQGCDLVAERDGVRVAIQCKKYSGAVGNSAVQEVAAGREYVEAQVGVVVTDSRYTDSARRLAQKTGVHLLHQEDLHELHRIVSGLVGGGT